MMLFFSPLVCQRVDSCGWFHHKLGEHTPSETNIGKATESHGWKMPIFRGGADNCTECNFNSGFWFPSLVVGDITQLAVYTTYINRLYIANWVTICYLPPIKGTRKVNFGYESNLLSPADSKVEHIMMISNCFFQRGTLEVNHHFKKSRGGVLLDDDFFYNKTL